jgi:N6-L-threonylcarbamoyladenine synthase
MTHRPGLDFSFSGLKTHTRLLWQRHQDAAMDAAAKLQLQADIAAGFQQAVVDTLTIKCRRAMQQTQLQQLVVSGGVAANQALRSKLQQVGSKQGFKVSFPRLAYCTDNGAMIAYAGCLRLTQSHLQAAAPAMRTIDARPRWPLQELEP